MTDKKKQTEAGFLELSEEELSKAAGGGVVFIPAGGAKRKKKTDEAADQSIIHDIASGADLG